jgi:hypothetical protein
MSRFLAGTIHLEAFPLLQTGLQFDQVAVTVHRHVLAGYSELQSRA